MARAIDTGNGSHHNGGAHHGPREGLYVPFSSPSQVTHDLEAKHVKISDKWWSGVAAAGILLVLGIIGFVIRLGDGVGDRIVWGYYAMMFAFILTTAQAAPMVAIAPRFANAHWRRPISRAAELWTAAGIFNLILFIPMLWILPPLTDNRRTLWFFLPDDPVYSRVPIYSPHIWATAALLGLVILGLALLWLSAMPDLALMRDNGSGSRQKWAARLSHRMGIVGALYFMMLIFVHFLISVDFLIALVPGWIDSLFPATHAFNSLQAGVATVILTMIIMRQFGGYKEYITLEQFWGMSKLLFALSLLWFWFWFSSFNILWYGKKPNEQAAMQLLMFGPYQPVFFAVFILNFAAPLFVMMWNVVRKSIWGPTIMSVGVLVGTFLDRLRLYVAAYSVPGIGDPAVEKAELALDAIPRAHLPDVADILIILGVLGGSVLFFLLFSRLIPPMNVWEQKELMLYKVHKPFHRARLLVLGKPR
jgi:hypothetical protein